MFWKHVIPLPFDVTAAKCDEPLELTFFFYYYFDNKPNVLYGFCAWPPVLSVLQRLADTEAQHTVNGNTHNDENRSNSSGNTQLVQI